MLLIVYGEIIVGLRVLAGGPTMISPYTVTILLHPLIL